MTTNAIAKTDALSLSNFQALQSSNFEIPSKKSQFMKLENGENRFRIVGEQFLEGFMVFTEGKNPKPVRKLRDLSDKVAQGNFSRVELETIKAKRSEENPEEFEQPKYFWVFLVYNQSKRKFQVLEITQKSVIEQLLGILRKEDYADYTKYDFIVTRTGSSKNDTEYAVLPAKEKALPTEVLDELLSLRYNLANIIEGKYPFDI